jgi:drug/metabolite transporter (DMT)-like permease
MKLDPFWRGVLIAYGTIVTWMTSSGAVVLHNKWLMTVFHFEYPATMTMMHMSFSFCIAFAICKVFKLVALPVITTQQVVRAILPIGACYSVVLVCSNYAYVYLTVAFIQMLKACLPVLVLFVSIAFGVAKFERQLLWSILVISIGVILVTEGQVDMSLPGLILQSVSLVFESVRLVMIEVLLKQKGIQLNPITTLYYVAPVTLLCISIPAAMFEFSNLDKIISMVTGSPLIFLANCSLAFLLNLAVFLIIGKTSALTMNIAGISKDIIVIGISTVMFAAPLYMKSIVGFGIVIVGVSLYNWVKYKLMAAEKAEKALEDEVSSQGSDSRVEMMPFEEKPPNTEKHF